MTSQRYSPEFKKEAVPDYWSFTGVKASALPPKADIRLVLAVMTANDPKQTFRNTQ